MSKKNNILFVCMALHPELTTKAISLVNARVLCLWNIPYLVFYENILFHLDKSIDWAIIFHEDTFIFDENRIYDIIKYMGNNQYDVSGMPDGGVIILRVFNPLTSNPLFNIFNVKKIRELKHKLDLNPNCSDIKHLTPKYMFKDDVPWKYDDTEIYNPLYFALHRAGCKCLWLDAIQHTKDKYSTYLFDHNHKPFLIHTWYARYYHTTEDNGRIDKIFEENKTFEFAMKNLSI